MHASPPVPERPSLEGRTVLVTGASRGIGQAIARQLVSEGARVVAHYHSSAEGAAAAVAGAADGRSLLLQADLGLPGEAARLWAEAEAWAGRVDALVCNAAIMPKVDLDDETGAWDETWQHALQVNTLSQAELVRAATRHYLAHGGGTLVALSSWVTQQGAGHPSLMAYAASKAAFAAMMKTVARGYAADGVLAYLVAPGSVDTEMTHAAAAERGGADAMREKLAMKEFVPPSEIADLVALLCSGRVRHLSGATLDVNGASYVR